MTITDSISDSLDEVVKTCIIDGKCMCCKTPAYDMDSHETVNIFLLRYNDDHGNKVRVPYILCPKCSNELKGNSNYSHETMRKRIYYINKTFSLSKQMAVLKHRKNLKTHYDAIIKQIGKEMRFYIKHIAHNAEYVDHVDEHND